MARRSSELSEKQKLCLRFVYQGLTSKQIAPIVETTHGVVDNLIADALIKMELSSRREAARILVQQENSLMQQLHMQPAAVASATITSHQMHRADDQRDNISQIMGLPPIGGRRNELPVSQRLLAISRIAFIAALMLIASVILIQGILILLT